MRQLQVCACSSSGVCLCHAAAQPAFWHGSGTSTAECFLVVTLAVCDHTSWCGPLARVYIGWLVSPFSLVQQAASLSSMAVLCHRLPPPSTAPKQLVPLWCDVTAASYTITCQVAAGTRPSVLCLLHYSI